MDSETTGVVWEVVEKVRHHDPIKEDGMLPNWKRVLYDAMQVVWPLVHVLRLMV